MPMYEFKCRECGHRITKFFKMDEVKEHVVVSCKDPPPDGVDAVLCGFDRVFSSFSGKFGDTPTHHNRAPRK